MCNTMQELSERENAIKLGGTGNHLSDTTLRRQLAKTLEQKRPRHFWFSLRCGSYCTPVPTVHNKSTTSKNRQNVKNEEDCNKNFKEHLNWQDYKLDSEETYTGNGLINVQLGTLISFRKECESYV